MRWRHLPVALGAVSDVTKAFGMQCFLPPESGSVSNLQTRGWWEWQWLLGTSYLILNLICIGFLPPFLSSSLPPFFLPFLPSCYTFFLEHH